MKLEVDWSQASTIKGAVWVTVGVLSVIFISMGDFQKASAIETLGPLIAGGLGVAIKD